MSAGGTPADSVERLVQHHLVGAELLPDHLERQPRRVALAAEHPGQPSHPDLGVESPGARQLAPDQTAGRLGLGIAVDLVEDGPYDLVGHALATQLDAERPARQTLVAHPGLDPGAGERLVVDEPDP